MPDLSTPAPRLLIVDDEAAHMKALCATLADIGYHTTGFTSAGAALDALRRDEFDLLLTDLMMPELNGIELLGAAQQIDPNVVAIVMTGHGAIDTAVEAMKAGAIDFIQKPFRLAKIRPVLTRALLVRQLRTENIQLREAVSIHELTTAFTRQLDWRAIAVQLADAAAGQSDAGTAAVLVSRHENGVLHAVASRGAEAEKFSALDIVRDAELVRWIEGAREKLLDPHPTDAFFAAAPHFAPYSIDAAIPMLAGGNFAGVLIFSSGQTTRTLTPGNLKTLIGLASAAASALENALLLDKLRNANLDLERCVRQRTAQLEIANKELEAFSYSVSHDLRSPLRTIEGYAAVLLEAELTPLPAQARQSAQAIKEASQRMMQLIGDLLELSRLGTDALQKTRVDIDALARRIVDETYGPGSERHVEVCIDALPHCMGDESLLRQVLANLIGNAGKFTKHRSRPRIEIGASRESGEIVYYVRDNGAGFDMREAGKLFAVFQRLHDSKEFEGTGIGLSIVQRIVGRHGGRVWAEGEVDKGAVFYFSLPE